LEAAELKKYNGARAMSWFYFKMALLFGCLIVAFIEPFVEWYVNDAYPWARNKMSKKLITKE